MRLLYITTLHYPSPYANRVNVMKMSQSFAELTDYKIILGDVSTSVEDVFREYGIDKSFAVAVLYKKPPVLRPRAFFAALKIKKIIASEPPETIFYIRDFLLAYFLSWISGRFRSMCFIECHALDKFPRAIYKCVLQKARGIISTNNAKKKYMVESFSIPAEKILVAPNGFDARLFANALDRAQARRELGFGENEKIVLYAGSMQDWKGVGMLFQLARALPAVKFVVVGASHDSQKNGVDLIRSQPYWRVPLFLKAADMLIAPYQGSDTRVQLYFSPIKIFEYMASGTPMIVSDIPAIREIVDDERALFAKMSSHDSFAEKIVWAFEHEAEMEKRAATAKKCSDDFSWEARALRIEEFIKHMS